MPIQRTIGQVSLSAPETRAPRRGILRLAGVLTQLICAGGLLIGTVAFVIVKQNAHGAGIEFVIGWLVAAMIGLVSGGLVYRGSLSSLVLCAAVDAALGSVLLLIDSALGVLVRILPASDVDTLAVVLRVLAFGMIVVAALCVIAIPQARRYASWLESADEPSPSTTSKGFPPPPVQSWRRSMQMSIVEASSRRTFWFIIGGIAVGAGAGIAVITTSSSTASTRPAIHDKGSAKGSAGDKRQGSGPAIEKEHGSDAITDDRPPPPDAAVATLDAGSAVALTPADAGTNAGPVTDAGTQSAITDSLDTMLDGEHVDLAKGDIHALAQRAVPAIYGFGVDADEVIDSRTSFETVLNRDLGAPPPGGFDIELKYLQVGQERDFAWTAEDLAITSHGKTRRFGITQLVGKIDNKWAIIAWQWAFGVADATASRLVHDGTMPVLKPITDAHANAEPVDAAFRGAFASPAGYAEAISSRGDAFNFGSSSEHVVGGSSVKAVFAHLPAKLGVHDGVHALTISPYVGIAAANVDFTTAKTKQTFRVLSILLKERTAWHVIQTQWSNGGPIK